MIKVVLVAVVAVAFCLWAADMMTGLYTGHPLFFRHSWETQ